MVRSSDDVKTVADDPVVKLIAQAKAAVERACDAIEGSREEGDDAMVLMSEAAFCVSESHQLYVNGGAPVMSEAVQAAVDMARDVRRTQEQSEAMVPD